MDHAIERRKLFDSDSKEKTLFHAALDTAIERARGREDDILELTDSMDRQQLETGYKHIIQRMHNTQVSQQKYKQYQTSKSSISDSQLKRSKTEKLPTEPNTPDRTTKKRYTFKVTVPAAHTPRWNISPPGSRKSATVAYDLPKLTSSRPKKSTVKATDVIVHEDDQPDKPRKPAAKLESYAGHGASLETFLAKLERHSEYFGWSEKDRVFQLTNSLTGTAAQALWIGGEYATCDDLIKILESRYGMKKQAERFRSELKARRRRPGESLQDLCHDICRLMGLANPNETGALAERLSIDTYLVALIDHNMRLHVSSKDPETLEDALTYSIRPATLDPASYVYDDKGTKKESVRSVEVVSDKQREYERNMEAQKALNDKCQRKIADQQRQLDSWRVWNDENICQQAAWNTRVTQDWRSGTPAHSSQQTTSSYRGKWY